MASRPLIKPFPVIINGDMTTTVTSAVTIVDNLSAISYDISWAGTAPSGTFAVQVSNTYKENANSTAIAVAGDWNTLPLSSTPAASGNTGNGGIDIQITGFNAIRLVYTPVSGTGVLNAIVACKVH